MFHFAHCIPHCEHFPNYISPANKIKNSKNIKTIE
nr:MAG TPA: ubiquinol-cytochrome-c reductase complex core protein [Caudoviricetes sp.]DAO82436.1 MAG TPA: ubiquinol-cytochrome-c reductase complex core protein [Caudoviricetes sp.]